jgi:ABC-type phosphonate transport system ATPase subunit
MESEFESNLRCYSDHTIFSGITYYLEFLHTLQVEISSKEVRKNWKSKREADSNTVKQRLEAANNIGKRPQKIGNSNTGNFKRKAFNLYLFYFFL